MDRLPNQVFSFIWGPSKGTRNRHRYLESKHLADIQRFARAPWGFLNLCIFSPAGADFQKHLKYNPALLPGVSYSRIDGAG